jgi:SSS family solute:Na+ symporter
MVIGWGMGGFRRAAEGLLASPGAYLLTRERISPFYFFSYTFIPLSAIAFPHITIFCLTARRMSQFKKTVVFYPLCIMAIWLPCVFLGVMANRAQDIPQIKAKVEARRTLATQGAQMAPEQRDALRAQMAGDDVILLLLDRYAPAFLAGLLGAGIMAAVMASDSQILGLSTMFSEDVFAHYGGRRRFGEGLQVGTARAFVVILTVLAYAIALRAPESIFSLAIQYAFSGFAAMAPLLIAALFWRGSTKWGALASTLWVAVAVIGVAVFQAAVPAPAPGPPIVAWKAFGLDALARTAGGTTVFGFMPVVPMVLVSALLMFVVSVLTPKPSAATVARYFPTQS